MGARYALAQPRPDDDLNRPIQAGRLGGGLALGRLSQKPLRVPINEGLGKREKEVLKIVFDLDDGGEPTLEEVCQRFRATREWLPQIEEALSKLTHPNQNRRQKNYLGEWAPSSWRAVRSSRRHKIANSLRTKSFP